MNLLKFPIGLNTDEDRLVGALGYFLAVHYKVEDALALPCAINIMSIVQEAIEKGIPVAIERIRQDLIQHNQWAEKNNFKQYNLEDFDYNAKGIGHKGNNESP